MSDHSFLPGVFFLVLFGVGGAGGIGVFLVLFGAGGIGVFLVLFGVVRAWVTGVFADFGVRALAFGVGVLALGVGALGVRALGVRALGVRALGVGGFATTTLGDAAFGEAGLTGFFCISDSLGVMVLPWMARSATSFLRSAGGATTLPMGLSMWAICVRVFLPDLVSALAAGASERGVRNRSATLARSAALGLPFLPPDLGVLISRFTPPGLMLLRTFIRAWLGEGLAAFFALLDLGVFFCALVRDVWGVVLTLGGVFGGRPLVGVVVFFVLVVGVVGRGLASPPASGSAIPAERGIETAAERGVVTDLPFPLGVGPSAAADAEGLGVLRPFGLGAGASADFDNLGVWTSLASPKGLGVAGAALEGFGVFISRAIPLGL